MRAAFVAVAVAVLPLVAAPVAAQRPYTEGPVTFVSYIRTKPGKFQQYMRYLAGPYKQLMEAQKQAGIITEYAVLSGPPRDQNDWNVVLTTTYRNMAALDGLDDRTDPIADKVVGNQDQRDKAAIEREAMREVVDTGGATGGAPPRRPGRQDPAAPVSFAIAALSSS